LQVTSAGAKSWIYRYQHDGRQHHMGLGPLRSAFDDWASETTDHAPHFIDMALAHKIPDATKAAYRRGDLFIKRRALMTDWDGFCSTARQDWA
jgi:hypothetical protein